jgi:hypothetical protein
MQLNPVQTEPDEVSPLAGFAGEGAGGEEIDLPILLIIRNRDFLLDAVSN